MHPNFGADLSDYRPAGKRPAEMTTSRVAAACALMTAGDATLTVVNLCSEFLRRAGGAAGPWMSFCSRARGVAAAHSIVYAGAAAIAEALKVNKTVATIYLRGACRAARRARDGSMCGVAVVLTGAGGSQLDRHRGRGGYS